MITEDGTANGKFLGLVTDKDYRISRVDLNEPVSNYMVPKDKICFARKGITLSEANDMIWDNKISCLPILDENDNLDALVDGTVKFERKGKDKKQVSVYPVEG